MQANLGLMFERKAKISRNSGQSVIKNLTASKTAGGRLGKQTSARKTRLPLG